MGYAEQLAHQHAGKEISVPVNVLNPALFLDRDGVVNREVGYLSRPEQVEFLPGIFDLCRSAQAIGHKLIVVTNQAGIARELYSESDFHLLMQWMIQQFADAQIRLDGYYFCPHHPEHGIGRYRIDCSDRKPQPGMLLKAAREHEIDLSRSLFVGDRCSDMQAGAAAGVGKLVLLQGTESAECELAADHVVVTTLAEVKKFLTGSA
jgi:D-glycero-D-manno-heptose 1,7-bisphosphate phosphatase